MSTTEDKSNIASGHKANLSNPSTFPRHQDQVVTDMTSDTSEESKQHSKQVLDSLGGEDAFYGEDKKGDSAACAGIGNDNNILGGHKAALNNPNTSEEAKEHSRKILEEAGAK